LRKHCTHILALSAFWCHQHGLREQEEKRLHVLRYVNSFIEAQPLHGKHLLLAKYANRYDAEEMTQRPEEVFYTSQVSPGHVSAVHRIPLSIAVRKMTVLKISTFQIVLLICLKCCLLRHRVPAIPFSAQTQAAYMKGLQTSLRAAETDCSITSDTFDLELRGERYSAGVFQIWTSEEERCDVLSAVGRDSFYMHRVHSGRQESCVPFASVLEQNRHNPP
jgi:hypothetical protein